MMKIAVIVLACCVALSAARLARPQPHRPHNLPDHVPFVHGRQSVAIVEDHFALIGNAFENVQHGSNHSGSAEEKLVLFSASTGAGWLNFWSWTPEGSLPTTGMFFFKDSARWQRHSSASFNASDVDARVMWAEIMEVNRTSDGKFVPERDSQKVLKTVSLASPPFRPLENPWSAYTQTHKVSSSGANLTDISSTFTDADSGAKFTLSYEFTDETANTGQLSILTPGSCKVSVSIDDWVYSSTDSNLVIKIWLVSQEARETINVDKESTVPTQQNRVQIGSSSDAFFSWVNKAAGNNGVITIREFVDINADDSHLRLREKESVAAVYYSLVSEGQSQQILWDPTLGMASVTNNPANGTPFPLLAVIVSVGVGLVAIIAFVMYRRSKRTPSPESTPLMR
eukprot:PLAT15369.1.p1 GENE.PLAT15369.1~~PLAT15369.1.p1  ORF type:complete len:398 (+),score=148.23 PLAT15369.1:31-1224(+)